MTSTPLVLAKYSTYLGKFVIRRLGWKSPISLPEYLSKVSFANCFIKNLRVAEPKATILSVTESINVNPLSTLGVTL